MKNTVFTFSTILFSFLFGVFVTYIAMSKQQMDTAFTNKAIYQETQFSQLADNYSTLR